MSASVCAVGDPKVGLDCSAIPYAVPGMLYFEVCHRGGE